MKRNRCCLHLARTIGACIALLTIVGLIVSSALSAEKLQSKQGDAKFQIPVIGEGASKVCPAIEPLTLVEIVRCPTHFPSDSWGDSLRGGRVVHHEGGTLRSAIAQTLGDGEEELLACYRSSGVSASILGLRLTTPEGEVVSLATRPSSNSVTAVACWRTKSTTGATAKPIALAPKDVLVFAVALRESLYVVAIAGALLTRDEIVTRKAAFMKEGRYSATLPIETTIVSPDTIPCLAAIRDSSDHR